MGRRKKCPKTEEEETAERQREISSKILQAYNLILPCIMDYMTKDETMHHLYAHHNLEPVYTENVWDRLVEQNNEFFGTYLVRLALKKRIERFNECLERNKEKMLLDGFSFVSQSSDPGSQTSNSLQVTGQTQINVNCSTNPSVAETNGYPSENLSFTAVNNNFSHHPHSGGNGVNGVPVHARHPVNRDNGVSNYHMRHHPYSRSQRNIVSQNSDLRCQTSNSMQVTGKAQINTNCSTNTSIAATNGCSSGYLSFSAGNNSFSRHPHSRGIGANSVPVRAPHPVNRSIAVDNGHLRDTPYSGRQWKDVADYIDGHHPHSRGIGANSVPVRAPHPVDRSIGVDNGPLRDTPYSGSQRNDLVDYSLGHYPHSGAAGVNSVPVHARHLVNGDIGVDNGHIHHAPYSRSQWNEVVDYSVGHHPHSGGMGANSVPFHAHHLVNGGIGVDNGHIDGSHWSNGAGCSLSHFPHSATH